MTESIATSIARAAYWPYLGQDNMSVTSLQRCTPIEGVRSVFNLGHEVIKPPVPNAVAHYYVSTSPYHNDWTQIKRNDQRNQHLGVWLSLAHQYDQFKFEFDLYTHNGIQIPKQLIYYRTATSGLMYFAIAGLNEQMRLSISGQSVYLKMYNNIYYTNNNISTGSLSYHHTKVTTLADAASFVDIQNLYDPNKILCYRNGYKVDRHTVVDSSVDDYLELYVDPSIESTNSVSMSKIPYYYSDLDNCNKFVYVMNNNGIIESQERVYLDDVNFYLYSKTAKKGVLLHNHTPGNIRNITHNIFAISAAYLETISTSHGLAFALSNCSILAIAKKDNSSVKVFNTTLLLNDLYYNQDTYTGKSPEEIAKVICSDDTLLSWRGSQLELGVLGEFMRSKYGFTDRLSLALVGYHSLFDVFGNNVQDINSDYKIPMLFEQSFTLQGFDSGGLALKNNVAPFLPEYKSKSLPLRYNPATKPLTDIPYQTYQGTPSSRIRYYPKLQQSELCRRQFLAEGMDYPPLQWPKITEDLGLYNTHLGLGNVELDPLKDYRFYVKYKNESKFSVAEANLHYRRTGNNLKWLINTNGIDTLIRDNHHGYIVHGEIYIDRYYELNSSGKDFNIAYSPSLYGKAPLIGDIDIGNGWIIRSETCPWGYIHVYLNGKRLIENVDYTINTALGTISLYHSDLLLGQTRPSNKTHKYTIYCFGHPNSDMKRWPALEFGVAYNGLISNNAKYESYKNRNCTLVINGQTHSPQTLYNLIASEINTINNDVSVQNMIDGRFYLIEDNYWDVGWMYQSRTPLPSTTDLIEKEHIRRQEVENVINAYKISKRPMATAITHKTKLVSLMFNSFILNVKDRKIPIPSLTEIIDLNALREKISLGFTNDIAFRWNTDLLEYQSNIDLYPTFNQDMTVLNAAQYRYVKTAITLFVPDFDMSAHFFIA